jgi:curved DNA-binding protein
MSEAQEFTDYYDILQVSPNCDIKLIEGAYRHFAKIYHPDHEQTADVERFAVVIDAYNTLKFPHKRAEYDLLYQRHKHDPAAPPEPIVSSETALTDAALQRNMLMFLYKSRRENFKAEGVGPFTLQERFHCNDDNFAFHVWYLKSKGFIEVTEHGTLAITADGVDYVIALHEAKAPDKLLTDQSG